MLQFKIFLAPLLERPPKPIVQPKKVNAYFFHGTLLWRKADMVWASSTSSGLHVLLTSGTSMLLNERGVETNIMHLTTDPYSP